MDPYVVLVAPDHVPDEFGGSYEDVCQELGLAPIPGGYVLYLLDSVNGRATVISTNTRATREAVRDHPATGDGYWVTDLPTVAAAAASDGLVDVVAGWPEELGGGIRCVFCREPDPEWVYEGADVRVLLDEPASSALPREVLGTEVVGCIDWPACGACHDLIEAADQRSWHRLLDRHDPRHVPMPRQAAWREFWTNHRPPRSAPPAEWTPGRRRIIANHIRRNWDQATAEYAVDDLPFTDDLDVPELAGPAAAYRAAHTYLREAPPYGRVRCYPTNDETVRIVRADGEGWSLIGRTGPAAVAYILLDTAPNAIHASKGPKTSQLLEGLAELVVDNGDK